VIQLSLSKLGTLLAATGVDIAEHPDLAGQVMALNAKLADNPLLTAEMLHAMLTAVIVTDSDAPVERQS
jgi:hypothetical protein